MGLKIKCKKITTNFSFFSLNYNRVVPFGANNTFTMPLQMTFWGKEENRKAVLDELKKHGFKLGPAPKCKFRV